MSHRRDRDGGRSNSYRDKAIESVALAYLIHLRDDLDASANDVVLTANLVRSLCLSHITFFNFLNFYSLHLLLLLMTLFLFFICVCGMSHSLTNSV